MRLPQRRPHLPVRDDRGAVTVIVALFLLIFMTLLAFVVDFGRVYATQAQLQNAADAAALAAARDLPVSSGCAGQPPSSGTTACKVAGDYVLNNGFGRADATVTSTAGSDRIAVQVSTTVPFVFGQLVGVSGRTLSARAVASNGGAAGGSFAIYAGDQITINGGGSAGMNVTGAVFAGGTGGSCPNHCALEFNGQASNAIVSGGAFAPSANDIKGDYRTTSGGSNITTATASATSTSPVQYATDMGLIDVINALPQSGSGYLELTATQAKKNDPLVCDIDLGAAAYAGKQVLYCPGDLKVRGTANTSLKMLRADGNITLDLATLGSSTQAVIVSSINGTVEPDANAVVYGTIYAPNGEVRTNGHAFTVRKGRVIAANVRVNGNGDTFSVDTTGDPYAPKGVQLIQ